MSPTDCERVINSVWNPINKNAMELARKATTSQNILIVFLVADSMAERIVKLPKYNPVTATAMIPDAPIPVANAKDPYTAETVSMVSAILSSIKLDNNSATKAMPNPTRRPPKSVNPKLAAASSNPA